MKKYKLVNTFLKVGRIVAIVLIALFALLFVIFTIIGIVGLVNAIANGTDEDIAIAVGVLVSSIIEYSLLTVFTIIGLVFNGVASKGVKAASSKAEIKKPAIFAIVSGALVTLFGIPAGIIALTMSDEDFAEANAEKPVDVKPAEDK